MRSGKAHFGKKIVKGIIFFAVVFSLATLVVMALWNWLMPEIFGLEPLSFWQSAGLLLLSKILFSGIRKPGYNKSKQWGWKKKWDSLSEEEKEKWKERFKDYGVS